MIVSTRKILELNDRYHLLENLCERESYPEGVGIDIRVGEVYSIEGEGYLGVEERKTPEIELVASIRKGDKEVTLGMHEFVLVKTMEKVNLPAEKIVVEDGMKPAYLMMDVRPRSTLQRCGIYFMGTKTDPGYHGELTFALANLGKKPFRLELGARIANVVFQPVLGDIHRAYGGQWNGGRVSTGSEKEKQV